VSAYGDFGPGNEDSLEYADVLKNWNDEDVAAYRDVVEGKEDVDLLGVGCDNLGSSGRAGTGAGHGPESAGERLAA